MLAAAVQTVRNALRAFRDREERRRANSQESPVVSQTPTDADDAPQPSDSDARIDGPDGRSHGIDGQDAPDEQKRSVPVEEEGQAEAEARVAETQESVRSSPRASRKRSAPDGFGFAPSDGIDEKRGKGEKESAVLEGMELKGESRWLDPVRGCDPPAGTETRGSVDGERRKKRCTGPEVEPTFEAAASGGEAQDENGREVAGKDRVPGDSGRELNPDTDGKAMLSGSELNGGAGRKGTTEGSFGVNLPGQMLVGSCDRSAAGLAEMAPGGKEPAETVTTGEKAVTNGLRSEPARLDWGGRGEEVAPLDPGKAAGGPEQGDPSRSQRAPWNDFRAGALVAHADGSPGGRRDPAAQLAVMSRSIAERAPEGMVTEKRPVTMAVKVQQLLTDPEWDTLDVVGLVEAQLFVSDLSSKIAACLRARAPDHFTRI